MNDQIAKKGARRVPKFRRRAEARPDEVLDAALELFIDKGFSATRVEDVAKRAGISKGSVYLYFPSKEALLEGLVRRAVAPVADNVLGILSGFEGDPRPAIEAALCLLAERMNDPKLFAVPKVVMREAVVAPAIAEMYRHEVLDRAIPMVAGLIERGIADGYLRPVDPELTVRSVVGPILTHMLLAEVFGIVPPGGIDMKALINNHLSILFDGLSLQKGEAP